MFITRFGNEPCIVYAEQLLKPSVFGRGKWVLFSIYCKRLYKVLGIFQKIGAIKNEKRNHGTNMF
ncbi:hypothetical protein KsCSTR_05790 [Candidatus Kuenenia stuttgartiensis]|uniref:Uncharacterized protein n=1 Tax=Kuenenia stuttgartiensis TaxID=174633 RepID=Q1Q011_KUEST|nr:hypothetical protein KsCSTR_05790 [Candidatus Kuenenia stuttgartiensis]TVM01603.1 MAG: hypothetical protein CV080_04000 [Candidatus Kuenenia stuttgartiensis]CAJ72662.1 unknown protein [Candidatus Kuenenia stuttgartiensis]